MVHFEIIRGSRDYLYRLPGEEIPEGVHLPLEHHTHQALVNAFCNDALEFMLQAGIEMEQAMRLASLFAQEINLVLEENMVEYLLAIATHQPEHRVFDLKSVSDRSSVIAMHAAAKQFAFVPSIWMDRGLDFADAMMRSAHDKLHAQMMSTEAFACASLSTTT